VLGAAVTVLLGDAIVEFVPYVLPFAAGAFLYIAAADLIPELHKERRSPRIVTQTLSILAGIGVMALLLLLE
jgi:zinc and cadmium transporter